LLSETALVPSLYIKVWLEKGGAQNREHSQMLEIPLIHAVMSIAFTAPYFTPIPSNVLAITSYNAMGGAGFDFALLYTPYSSNVTGGVAIDSDGRLAEVAKDKWEEIEKIVSGTETIELASWSRPQYVSCPTDVFYDLGPAQATKDLRTFQLTGHEVYEGGPQDEILKYKRDASGRYVKQVVKEIPDTVLKLESGLRELQNELFPRLSFENRPTASKELQAMMRAVDEISTAGRLGF